MSKITKLIISLVLPLAVGALGGLATASSVGTWYQTLEKPSFNPPSWVFGPVWTTLYILMGYAAIEYGLPRVEDRPGAMKLYWSSLVLNAAWSPIFFGLQSPQYALMVIIPLWMCILFMIIGFRRVDKLAAGLIVPYLLWVTFATVLNGAIVGLN